MGSSSRQDFYEKLYYSVFTKSHGSVNQFNRDAAKLFNRYSGTADYDVRQAYVLLAVFAYIPPKYHH